MVCTLFAYCILVLCCLLLPEALRCEQSIPWKFGISGGAGVQFHSSGPLLPLPPAAPPFQSARGPSLFLGLEVHKMLLPWLYGGVNISMQTWNGAFKSKEPTFFVIEGVGTPGTITHTVDLSLSSLGIAPVLTVPLTSFLSLSTGVQFSYALSNSYEQSEAVTAPSTLPFVYGERRTTGKIDSLRNLSFALTAALRYGIPLGNSLMLEPELRAYYSLSSLMGKADWRTTTVQGGVALVYAPTVEPPVLLRDTLYQRDTVQRLVENIAVERITLTAVQSREVRQENSGVTLITVEVEESYLREIPKPRALLAVAVDVRFVQADGSETESTTLLVEGHRKRHYMPLLPYVFFGENTDDLPEKYRKGFDKPQTDNAMLDMYYNLLDTVGERLKTFPRARLVLTGTMLNDEQGGEDLARRRALAVRSYLMSAWGIDPERIRVAARTVTPSNSDAEGKEEGRRVELSSDNERILASVVLSNIEVIADPPVVRFYPDVISDVGTARWLLSVAVDSTVLRDFSGGGAPPNVVEWDIASTPMAARLLSGDMAPMRYDLSVVDAEGATAKSALGTLRFQQANAIADGSFVRRTTERFSLILFDVNTASLSAENRAVVQLVRSMVSPRDSVRVEGFSDATGSKEYNEKLSQRRAETIASVLKLPRYRVEGLSIDASLPPYLPEGRFYSRRVDIVRE